MLMQRSLLATMLLACLFGRAALADESEKENWLSRVRLLPGENERSHRSVKAAFRPAVKQANRSTVRVLSEGTQVSLGAIVRSNGFVVTKASDLKGRIECQFADGRRRAAKLVGLEASNDIALLKVEAQDLPVARWSSAPSPIVGSWVATAGPSEYPTAIGIVSADARQLPRPQTVLGVGLEQVGRRARVNRVLTGSAAAKAGVQTGDFIANIDGAAMKSTNAVSATIQKMLPGDKITLGIERGNRIMSLRAVLGEVSRLGNPDQAELMDSLGGPLSNRRHGFPYVLQHDTVLQPRDCGGPLVDLDGRIIGINIARVSRVASYAIPAHQMKPLLNDLFAGKYPPAADSLALEQVSTND